MRARLCRGILFGLFTGAVALPVLAQNAPFSFEGFVDSTVLTNQYAGATFANAAILTAGITLNEFEFPPHSGSSVASDNGGPLTIIFASPVSGFSGYFSYSVPLTLQALDAANNPLVSANSAFSNNQALSGASGSHPNELLMVSSAASIHKIVITGGSLGASFTMDDAVVLTKCDLNQDGFTNVTDTQAILNQALGATAATADLNGDGAVSVADVQIVIDAALLMGCVAN